MVHSTVYIQGCPYKDVATVGALGAKLLISHFSTSYIVEISVATVINLLHSLITWSLSFMLEICIAGNYIYSFQFIIQFAMSSNLSIWLMYCINLLSGLQWPSSTLKMTKISYIKKLKKKKMTTKKTNAKKIQNRFMD